MKLTYAPVALLIAFAWTCHAADVIRSIAGTGRAGYSGDGGLATSAALSNPYGLAAGPDGCLYICDMDNHVVRKIDAEGKISTVAGTGRRGYSGNGGPALKADLNEPYEVRFDARGDMFIVEMRNHAVRRVDQRTGVIELVAGIGTAGFSGDGGAAITAALSQPHSIQFGPGGELFICDIGNNRIRKVDMKSGRISTFGGTGEKKKFKQGDAVQSAPLNGPRAVDFDASGNMWLALREGNAICRVNMKELTIEQVAGTGAKGFSGNGGPAREATLSGPKGISAGNDGLIYFADTESHSIRAIDTRSGKLELIAGSGSMGAGNEGAALMCEMARPHGIFVTRDGAIYVGDSENHRVRMITRAQPK